MNNFDWKLVLSSAIINKPTQQEWLTIKKTANSWETGAIGIQSKLIPRYNQGQPIDKQLIYLERKFYAAICFKQYINAKTTLNQIEDRCKIIINNLN